MKCPVNLRVDWSGFIKINVMTSKRSKVYRKTDTKTYDPERVESCTIDVFYKHAILSGSEKNIDL